LSRRVLNISREGDSTTSLGSLFQGSVTLRRKKFFLKFPWPELSVWPDSCSGPENPPRPPALLLPGVAEDSPAIWTTSRGQSPSPKPSRSGHIPVCPGSPGQAGNLSTGLETSASSSSQNTNIKTLLHSLLCIYSISPSIGARQLCPWRWCRAQLCYPVTRCCFWKMWNSAVHRCPCGFPRHSPVPMGCFKNPIFLKISREGKRDIK